MKSDPAAKTPEAYLASIPPGRQEILRTLHAEIIKAAPSLVPGICHGMLGYGIGPYQPKGGCEGEWCKVGLANQKQHVSLYLCTCEGDGHLVEKNAARLGKVNTAKSCIRFTKLEHLKLEVVMELVKTAAASG